MIYQFPFGEEVRPLRQTDRSPKKVFVLGVYASPVHANWVKGDDVIIEALPVANEPRLFWDGNEKEENEIISRIHIPEEMGVLKPAGERHNGPTASVLDEHILAPLGVSRDEAWLCDCLNEARLYPAQYKEIMDKYNPFVFDYNLNYSTIPKRPIVMCDRRRSMEITNEIIESQAELLVLLGDIAIGQFLNKAARVSYSSLNDYEEQYGYGIPSEAVIGGKYMEVLPLAHPRQIGVFGVYNEKWHYTHGQWEKKLKVR